MDILKKPYVWSFMGQVKNKPTRERMLLELQKLNYPNFLHITEKWGDENQIDVKEYKKILSNSIFCPCPSGWGGANGLKDCFRLYEALEAGSIPIVEMDSHQYFNKFFPDNILLQVKDDWSTIADDIQGMLANKKFLLDYHKKLMQWWGGVKNEIKLKIKEDFKYEKVAESPKSDDLNISVMHVPMGSDIIKKWVNIHSQLKSGKNILCVGGDLFPISDNLDINNHLGEYIDEDVDILLSKHNYSDWGQPLGSSLNSCFIYLKSTPLVHKMVLELINICVELNLKEDLRFFSYRERHFDYNLERLIKNYGNKINVKTIDNDKFAVSEEIYGKNIKHYKSNPPAYINFDRNVYTEELKKVYFSK
tara:strand:- start:3184 stop:4272 length:1089 start_codon:yes stop_codon:yes gene_type:complete